MLKSFRLRCADLGQAIVDACVSDVTLTGTVGTSLRRLFEITGFVSNGVYESSDEGWSATSASDPPITDPTRCIDVYASALKESNGPLTHDVTDSSPRFVLAKMSELLGQPLLL